MAEPLTAGIVVELSAFIPITEFVELPLGVTISGTVPFTVIVSVPFVVLELPELLCGTVPFTVVAPIPLVEEALELLELLVEAVSFTVTFPIVSFRVMFC